MEEAIIADRLRLRAGNGIRTRDPQLGKLMLYQLSYSRFSAAKVAAPVIPRPTRIAEALTYF